MGILRTCINLGELDVFLAFSVDCPFGDHSEALEHTQLCDTGTVTVPIYHSGKQTPRELNGLTPRGTGGFLGVGPPARGLVWGRMWTLEAKGSFVFGFLREGHALTHCPCNTVAPCLSFLP